MGVFLQSLLQFDSMLVGFPDQAAYSFEATVIRARTYNGFNPTSKIFT